MTVSNQGGALYQNAGGFLRVTLTDALTGAALDVTNLDFEFRLYEREYPLDATTLKLTKTESNGITYTFPDSSTTQCLIEISAADTASLEQRVYFFHLVQTAPSVSVAAEGTLEIKPGE